MSQAGMIKAIQLTPIRKVDVPEGFSPQSIPCDPATRIPTSDILLERVKEADLLEIADGMHASFPELWWSKHEPPAVRAPPDVRTRRMAQRLRPYAVHPEVFGMVARSRATGEIMGFAGWQYMSVPGRLNAFSHDAFLDEEKGGWGFQKLMGWTDDELDEIWSGITLETWNKEFSLYDNVRKEEMGSQQHWYLAPLFVVENFRGRGVGRVLLDFAIEKADKATPPVPVYLEALPNARPVYLHCGFVPGDESHGPDRGPVMIRRGPLKAG